MRELVILEHLSYIISSIADTCTGEAKRQVHSLIAKVEKATDIDGKARDQVLVGLRVAQDELMERRERVAAVEMWKVSEFLWSRVMPAGATGRFQETLPGPWAKEIKPRSTLVSITFPPEIQAKMDKMGQKE
jgi:hypothetical protein